MIKIEKKIIIFLVVLLLFGCSKTSNKKSSVVEDSLLVAVSLDAQAFVVNSIAKDLVETVVVIPLNSDPHTYDANIKQIMKIASADIYFTAGLDVERKIFEKVFSSKKHPKVVRLFDSSLLLPLARGTHNHDEDHHDHEDGDDHDEEPHLSGFTSGEEIDELIVPLDKDPHFWLSRKGLIYSSEIITEELIQLFPESRESLEANKADLIMAINAKFDELKSISIEYSKVLVYHPSYQYLLEEVNIVQVPIQIEGKEPNLKQMNQIVELIKLADIPNFILVQPQYDPESVKILTQKYGLGIKIIDSLSANPFDAVDQAVDIFAGL
ncbi:MAG: zinc ABC transporter substrate-binding protein [Spirochaetales bacterium]|nr:zinc ABC transporter substrate-binding protein [Spirochaetales bacterium]